jgi:hypothetical protein
MRDIFSSRLMEEYPFFVEGPRNQAIRVFGAIRPLLGGSLILLRSISSMNLKKQTWNFF